MLLLLITIASILMLFADADISPMTYPEWHRFLNDYGRSYASDEEHDTRYEIFRSNLDFIRQHNARARLGLESYFVAINEFADHSNDEYAARLSFQASGARRSPMAVVDDSWSGSDERTQLPASIDWRAQGLVTPVKNQGKCGSCWSFAATGSMEGAYALEQHLANGTLPDFSEQELIDCVHDGLYTCTEGGDYTDAFAFVIANGTVSEQQYAYVSGTDPDPETCQLKKLTALNDFGQYVTTPTGSEYALQQAVAKRPGVAVAIDASHIGFQFYYKGVYKPKHCSRTELDHAVLVVGYGTDRKGGDYWIVKNSWGVTWGQDGYIWIARNRDNMCGIATMPAYILTSSQIVPNATTTLDAGQRFVSVF